MSEPDPPGEDDAAKPAEAEPAKPEPEGPARAAMSGSIDVRFSDTELPAVDAESAPASGPPRRKRARTMQQLAHDLGEKVVHAGDAALDKMVKVSERAGESLSHLPVAQAVMPKTRRGRVMAKSVAVSFLLVFTWIAVIVGLQLRRPRPPDFRPLAQAVLIGVRDGRARAVYRDASVSGFQEVVREDVFVENMEDLNVTLGPYKEITAVLRTEHGRGPSGRFGSIEFRADYESGATRGWMSFRWEDRRWKLLYLQVDVPPDIVAKAGSKEMRELRVEGPRDELRAAAEKILKLQAGGEYDAIWSQAAFAFQQSITLANFRETEADRYKVLGPFVRILDVTSARTNPARTGANLVLLIEFEKATITGTFEFTKSGAEWKLTRYKLVLPLPRVPT